MDHFALWWGAFASLALGAACSSSPPPAAQVGDAGADGTSESDYPLLPSDCDLPLPVLSTGERLRPVLSRIRVVDGIVYSPHDDGIHATRVSGGSSALVMAYPTYRPHADASLIRMPFRDFWIDQETIVAALAGALFAAPLTGGPPTLLPGYSLPSFEDFLDESESYVRAGAFIYATSQLPTGGRGIRRHALSGGAPSDFVRFNDSSKYSQVLVASDDSLYYVDKVEPGNSLDAVFVTPLQEAMPARLPADFDPASVVGRDDHLYVLEGGGFNLKTLWRLGGDGTWTKLKVPFHAALPGATEIRYASRGGASYFTGFALYRTSDDLRTARRDVVFRVRDDSDTLEIARCLPEAAIDPTTPRSSLSIRILDLAVDGASLYVVTCTADTEKWYWKDHIVEVTP